MKRVMLAAILAYLAVTQARAHDSWLISDHSRVSDGEMVWLSFVTGEEFPFGESPTDPKRVAEFVDLSASARRDVTGYAQQDKGLAVRGPISGPGLHVLACALKPSLIDLEPAGFEEYLRSERAEHALSKWSNRADPDAIVTEKYTKFAKTIVEVLPTLDSDEGYLRLAGHRLEIVPLSNPNDWQAGGQARVRVFLDGYAWPDVPVSAGHEGLEKHQHSAETRTGPDGAATIALDRPGHWYITAYHIRPTAGIGRAQWESFWASLTFRVRGEVNVSGMLQSVRAVHGSIQPGAVVGYRMGVKALEVLGLKPAGDDVHITIAVPLVPEYACIADGVQAATGATVGKLNLVLKNAPAAESKVVFTNSATGRSIAFLPADQFRMMLAKTTGSDSDAVALRAATLPEGDIFKVVEIESPDSKPAASLASD